MSIVLYEFFPSDEFQQKVERIKNFHRVFPIRRFIQVVKDIKPPFYAGLYASTVEFSFRYSSDYVHVLVDHIDVPNNFGRTLPNPEFQELIEAFLLAYYNLWLAEDEIKLQQAFRHYEQLVRADLREADIRTLEDLLRLCFPRGLSYSQMQEVKHLSFSDLYSQWGTLPELYKFLSPGVTFTWKKRWTLRSQKVTSVPDRG